MAFRALGCFRDGGLRATTSVIDKRDGPLPEGSRWMASIRQRLAGTLSKTILSSVAFTARQ
jgi:hypothetical protein